MAGLKRIFEHNPIMDGLVWMEADTGDGGGGAAVVVEDPAAPEADSLTGGKPDAEVNEDPPAGEDPPAKEDDTPGEPEETGSFTDPDPDADPGENNDEGEVALEAYESFELPDGMEVNKDALDHFVPVMLERKVGQEDANAFAVALGKFEQQRFENINTQIEQGRGNDAEAVRADPILGGDNLQTTMSNVNRVFSQPGGAEVNAVLRAAGIDNNPAIVAWANGIGGNFAEDQLVNGNSGGGGDVRASDAMFPTTVGT